MFSQRTDWPHDENPLIAHLVELKVAGASIVDLTNSNPTQCGISYPDMMLTALSDSKSCLYRPEARGLPDVRKALAEKYYHGAVNSEHIFLTASTSEAYSFLLRLFTNPGDHILVPCPSYPLFEYLAQLNDVVMDTYPLHFDGSWSIDCEALAQCFCEKTKMLIAVNPNNPTGSFVKKEELNCINTLCKKHNTVIVSDEVFRDFRLDGAPEDCVSLCNNADVLTVTLNGASKSLGLPQMKIAWSLVSGPQEAVDECLHRLDIILDTYLSVNTPVQHALKKWLDEYPKIVRQITGHLVKNDSCIRQCLDGVGQVAYYAPEGGWYAPIRLPAVCSEEEWVFTFLDEDAVFVHPGYFFDFKEEPVIVASLLCEPGAFAEGFKKIAERIK